MLSLAHGAPLASSSSAIALKASTHIQQVERAGHVRGRTSCGVSTTTPPAQQRVVSAEEKCANQVWDATTDTNARTGRNTLQQHSIGCARLPATSSAAACNTADPLVAAVATKSAPDADVDLGSYDAASSCLPKQVLVTGNSGQQAQQCNEASAVLPVVSLQKPAVEQHACLLPVQKQEQEQPSQAVLQPVEEQQDQPNLELEFKKDLMRSMRDCSSLQQLCEIITQHGPGMDVMAVTSCFAAAARLVSQQQLSKAVQQSEQACVQVGQDNHGNRETQLEPVQFSEQQMHIHSLPDLQRLLLPLLVNKLHQLDAVGLVLVLRALVVLDFADDATIAAMEDAAMPLANQLTPRLLSQLVWCFGQLKICPQQALINRLLMHSGRQLKQQQWNSQDCVQMLHGLAQLGKRPPESWIKLFLGRIAQLMEAEQLQPAALCMVLHSCSKLSVELQYLLLRQLLNYVQPLLPSLSAVGLNMLANSLMRLKADPSAEWQKSYVQATHQLMSACDARNLAVLAVPLLRWRCAPAAGWVEQYVQMCEVMLQDMQPQGLAVLGHSLAGLQVLPSEQWRLRYLTAARTSGLATSPAGCSYLIHVIAAWQSLKSKCNSINSSEATTAAANTSSTAPERIGMLEEALVQQCMQCFVQYGSSFTAEQLGMMCKGLAALGLQGSPKLSNKLSQVTVATLADTRCRLTSATLTNILLALAVACPLAATPKLLQLLWGRFYHLIHTSTLGHAAAIAWAVARTAQLRSSMSSTSSSAGGLQPPELFIRKLVQRTAVVAEDASLQQLAVLLLQAKRAGWQLEPRSVQQLVSHLLQKQAAALNKCRCDSSENSADALRSLGSGSSDGASSTSSSSAGGGQAAWLFGSANHRLKSCMAATTAAASWAHILGSRSRMSALKNCEELAGQLQDSSMLPLLAVQVHCLAAGCGDISTGGVRTPQHVDQLQVPAALAALLWNNRAAILEQVPVNQQQYLVHMWEDAGLLATMAV